MFLKIATVLAILGVLLSLLLTLVHQVVLTWFYLHLRNPTIMINRLLTVGEALLIGVPLIIFFVAFLVSLKAKQG